MPRKLQVDTRSHWSDDLQVLFNGRWYDAESYRLLCERYMVSLLSGYIDWRDDPTYNLRSSKYRNKPNVRRTR